MILGDVNLWDMQNRFSPAMTLLEDNATGVSTVHQDNPERSQHFFYISILFVGLSFLVGVTLMNLFIAMLCLAYNRATENAWLTFMAYRAGVVIDLEAFQSGLKTLRKLLCRPFKRGRKKSLDGRPRTGTESLDYGDDAVRAYMWILCASSSPSSSK